MAEIYLTEDGSSIHKSGECLLYSKDGKKIFEIELKNIETVQIFANVNVTTPVVKEFMERGIELAYYKSNGQLIGQLTPIHVKNVQLRYKQYELYRDLKFRTEFGKEIIKQKFKSCINVIEDGNKNRDDADLSAELKDLKIYLEKIDPCDCMESLLGIEGSFAKSYYTAYGKLFKDMSLFNGRSKRPPKDEANAIMSFIYTLITNRISSFIDGIGFDPYLGFYHAMEYGRVSLGCDMIEPVRGIFCDRLTLNLFNMQTLKRKDFEMTEEGIRLTIDGRKIFFTKYSDELKKEKSYSLLKGTFHDYLDFMIGYVRTCIETGKAEPMHER